MGSLQLAAALPFLAPEWLFAIPPVLGGLLILYFLKLKRRQVQVASTFLWQRAIDDLRVNSPFQRLRLNLLLILQALALLALMLALSRPISDAGLSSSDSILLIDTSASMLAGDGDPRDSLYGDQTRFERAVEQARLVVEDLSYGDRALIMAFADEPVVLTAMTENKAVLRAALGKLEAAHTAAKLVPALKRVEGIITELELNKARVHVFSDGRVGSLDDYGFPDNHDLLHIRTGRLDAKNVGIVGVDVRTATTLGEELSILVVVQNSGGAGASVGVDCELVADEAGQPNKLLDSRLLELEPEATGSVTFEEIASDQVQRIQLRLDHDGPAGAATPDPFPLDDTGYALLRPPGQLRLLLVTPGNLFLASALSADPLLVKDARGEVPAISAEAFDPDDPSLLDYDVILLDRCQPERLPAGNYLAFASQLPLENFGYGGQAQRPRVLDWDEAHPVSRFVNFATLQLKSAQQLKPRDGDPVIVRTDQGPLVVEARAGDVHALLVGFDLMSLPVDGAWTFDPSFPIFLSSAARYLGGGGGGGGSGDERNSQVSVGETAELRFPSSARLARLTAPDQTTRELEIRPGDDQLRLTDLDQVGFYGVEFFSAKENGTSLGTRQLAVNLNDSEESQIDAAKEIALVGRAVVGSEEATELNQEIWPWVALLALIVVLAEWVVYNRNLG